MSRLKPIPEQIAIQLAVIAETPRRIAVCTAKISRARLSSSPGNKQWSPVEVLAHVRACDDLWSHSIYAMLTETNPALPDLDERGWAKTTRYGSLDFKQSLRAFTLKRAELLRVLRDLPDEGWARTCIIRGRAHSVFSQVRRLARHEADHCRQIERATASRI